MIFSSKLFFTILLSLLLFQSEFVKASTQTALVKKSDIFEIETSSEITETDFVETIKPSKKQHVWIINLRIGPYLNRDDAQQVAEGLKQSEEFAKYDLALQETNHQEIDFFEDKRTNRDKYSWMVNIVFGPYQNKTKAKQAAEDIRKAQKTSTQVFLERKESFQKYYPDPIQNQQKHGRTRNL